MNQVCLVHDGSKIQCIWSDSSSKNSKLPIGQKEMGKRDGEQGSILGRKSFGLESNCTKSSERPIIFFLLTISDSNIGFVNQY